MKVHYRIVVTKITEEIRAKTEWRTRWSDAAFSEEDVRGSY